MATFDSDDLLKGNTWKGAQLSEETLGAIRDEARNLKNSQLWKILKSEVEWFAVKSLIEKGETTEDIRIARSFGNVVQIIDGKLEELIGNDKPRRKL